MIAQYYLETETGVRRSLCVNSDVMLAGVQGLGLVNSNSWVNLEHGFYLNSYKTEAQDSIAGDLIFKGNAYETYRTFVNWVFSVDKLWFVYQPYGQNAYKRRVKIKSLSKAQRDKGGWMVCPVVFQCYTPWELPTSVNIVMERQVEYAMRYPYTYNTNLHYGVSSFDGFSAEITASGHLPSSITFTYTGNLLNPDIKLTGVSGKTYGEVKIAGAIGSTDTLAISTAYEDGFVKRVTAQGVETDLINNGQVDLLKNPFMRVPVTENCVLRFTSDSEIGGTAVLRVNYYYRSV